VRRATFLASVRDDFLAILTYIAETSGSVAIGEAFVRQLRLQCHKLAAMEGVVGRARPELRPDIRSFPYKNYVIFFRYVSGRFEVVHLLERHMDVEARFSAREEP
jgi:plasmid stabilization system protein ParE